MSQFYIPYGKQFISEDDILAVNKTLRSDFLTQGPEIDNFEKEFAAYIGTRFSVAVSNGTTALHLANLVYDIKPGDKIITTPITFAASANASLYCGAIPDFVDIDKKTFLIDLQKLEDKLKKAGKGTYNLVVPVDFAGYPVNLEELKTLADKYAFRILEDACHAPGGYFIDSKGNKAFCGDNQYAETAIFSFHPVKHIAAGEGGAVTTRNEQLFERLKLLRTHGITKNPHIMEQNHGGWYYEMHELGNNYRMTDFQAALAHSQLKRADNGLKKRREIARKYNQALSQIEQIKTPFEAENVHHAYHLYVVQAENRRELYDFLRQNGIFTQVHYIPLHLQPYYQKNFGFKKGDFPVSENYYQKALSLPMYPTLSEEEQDFVVEKIIEFYR